MLEAQDCPPGCACTRDPSASSSSPAHEKSRDDGQITARRGESLTGEHGDGRRSHLLHHLRRLVANLSGTSQRTVNLTHGSGTVKTAAARADERNLGLLLARAGELPSDSWHRKRASQSQPHLYRQSSQRKGRGERGAGLLPSFALCPADTSRTVGFFDARPRTDAQTFTISAVAVAAP